MLFELITYELTNEQYLHPEFVDDFLSLICGLEDLYEYPDYFLDTELLAYSGHGNTEKMTSASFAQRSSDETRFGLVSCS